MRKILAIILIGIVVVVLQSCGTNKTSVVVSSVMLDTTDSLTSLPDLEQIKQAYGFQKDLWNVAGIFRLRTIGSIAITNVEEHSIESAQSLTSNKLTRFAEVNRFFKHIETDIQQVISTPNESANSSIYATIVDEVSHLQGLTSTKKNLLIFSNLLENDPSFLSYYNKEVKQQILQRPQEVRAQYESTYPLTDMKGLDVWLIHDPGKDYDEARLYQQIAMMYKSIFLAHNASSVTIILSH